MRSLASLRPWRSSDIDRAGVVTVTLVALLVPLPLWLFSGQEVYWLFLGAKFFTYAIVAISLDLLMGRTGQISLGQNGFFAVGAYTAAVLSTRYNVDIAVAMAASGLVAALVSFVLGLPAIRLRGHYLAIVTFGFGIAIDQIALKWDAVTGGDEGLHLHGARLFGISISNPVAIYYFTLLALAVFSILVWNLTRTRIGRSFAAIRDSEVAAAAMGIPVARTKILAFLCSAFLTGVAGCLYAFVAGFIAPEDFGIEQAMLFFAMVVIGGGGSLVGAIGGALIVDSVQQGASTVSGLAPAILGGIIMATALCFPRGLKGLLALVPRTPSTPSGGALAIERQKQIVAE